MAMTRIGSSRDSTDESVTSSGDNSSAAKASAHINDRSWIAYAVLLVVALIVIVREESRAAKAESSEQQALSDLATAKRDAATELQLRRYNLDWFRTHEFAELEVKVGVLESRLNDNVRR
jgi:hypothetical protein